ncbi:MAG: NAD(P)H-dependent oxidoreductase subunit E [Candidatus Margulisbacteria bacterium]|jgi:NADH-quinone oxidoreductase subunit E|nr:NAD(P)H-dependent oxidoreductase subunit E [Candidatus Margulisiibacteriota bacterium]
MFTKADEEIKISAELREFIDRWRDKPGNLIMILHKVQEEYRYIPREMALFLSRELNVALAKIYGVITFYHFFKLKKPGKYNIQVCIGTACYLKGGGDILQELENLLGIGIGGVTADGLFSIEGVRCVGCCGLAPVAVCAGEVFGKLKKEQLPDIIAKYKEKA